MTRPKGTRQRRPIPDPDLPEDVLKERALRHKAYRLSARGRTSLEIAAELGVTEDVATKYVLEEAKSRSAILKVHAGLTGAKRIQFEIDRQLENINWLQSKLDHAVERGDVQAAGKVLQAIELRAKLLGLMSPERVEHSVEGLTASKVQEAFKNLFKGAPKLDEPSSDLE